MIQQTIGKDCPHSIQSTRNYNGIRYIGPRRRKKPSSSYAPGSQVLRVVRNILENFPNVITNKRRLLREIDEYEETSAGLHTISLIIGVDEKASDLAERISRMTSDHEIQKCPMDQAFDYINSRSFSLIWLIMDVPVGQDVLSLTTSIRYASKYNRGTVILGVTTAAPSVDLRLHGIDEIILLPATDDVIKEKYSKWTSVLLVQVKTETNPSSCQTVANNDVVGFNVTSSDRTTDRSHNNALHDSGIQSPCATLGKSTVQLPSISTLRQLVPSIKQETRIRTAAAADHTTKEKLRRERIKDSCDQLRVLLPYIRGRKTDMASILEMCVEYLKLVNAALPQDFQNQVIEILTTECSDSTNTNDLSTRGKSCPMTSTPSKVTTFLEDKTTDGSITGNTEVHNADTTSLDTAKSKRDHSKLKDPSKPVKRIRLQPKAETTKEVKSEPTADLSNQIPKTNSYDCNILPRAEQSVLDTNNNITGFYAMHHTQPIYNETDVTPRTFPGQESFPTYYAAALPPKLHCFDREAYGMYIEGHSMNHFYGNNAFQGFNVLSIPEYVNPNAVLPVQSQGKAKKTNPTTCTYTMEKSTDK